MKKMRKKARMRVPRGNPAKRNIRWVECAGCGLSYVENDISGHKKWCKKFQDLAQERREFLTIENHFLRNRPSMSHSFDLFGTLGTDFSTFDRVAADSLRIPIDPVPKPWHQKRGRS